MYSVEASVLLIRTTALTTAAADSLIPILSFDPPL